MTSPNYVGGRLTLVAATPTKIPMIVGTAGYIIENNDAASIIVNFDGSLVGITVPTGSSISINCTFQNTATGTQIWVVSSGGTSSNAIAYLGVL